MYLILSPQEHQLDEKIDLYRCFAVVDPFMANKYLKEGHLVYKLDLPRVTEIVNNVTTIEKIEFELDDAHQETA